ncbi:MAG: alpha/beta hydrolase [Pyrinomonadaceae bacterium]|jgi:acetyl esterase/lipase|nr:alpha/beta hydrolase [Pyrinomonadaceae bacterium]
MSLQNSLVKIYAKLVKYKQKAELLDAVQQQKENFLYPPIKVAKKCKIDLLEINGAKAVWLDKHNENNGVMIYLHGGSYIAGAFNVQWEYISDMCKRTNFAALLINYKLAPQYPFPNGLNDVITILESLNLSDNWFLLGDSAGGGLAVATCYKLIESDKKLPKKLILMAGWFDITMKNPDAKLNADEDIMLSYQRLKTSAEHYVGKENPENYLISPINGNVSKLPPTLMQIGTSDIFLADNRKFYQKCLDANVKIIYEEYKDCFHDFMMVKFLPEAKKARESQTKFLQ